MYGITLHKNKTSDLLYPLKNTKQQKETLPKTHKLRYKILHYPNKENIPTISKTSNSLQVSFLIESRPDIDEVNAIDALADIRYDTIQGTVDPHTGIPLK